MVQIGSVVECRDKKKVYCAVCLDSKPNQVRLLAANGKEFTLPVGKVVNETAHRVDAGSSRVHQLDALRAAEAAIEAARGEVDLAELWEVVHDEGRPFAVADLAELLWGAAATSDRRSALLRELVADAIYFDYQEDQAVPRGAEQVRLVQQQRQQAESRQLERQQAVELLRRAWQGEPVADAAPEGTSWLPLLQGLAVHCDQYERYGDATTLLKEIGIQTGGATEAGNAALQLLVRLGVWQADENLSLLRHQVPQRFSRAAVEQADALLHPGALDAQGRLDLRHLELFSVDDAETMDIDDALSCRQVPEGWEVGVHIADPAHFILPDSALDREATIRATSIYLPDRKIEMLPERLSQDLCSLVAGQDRYALTVLAQVSHDGRLQSWRLAESVIRVGQRLTYEQANELIEAGIGPCATLYERVARPLQRHRVAAGALIQDRGQLKIRVEEGGRVTVSKISPDQAAQLLVSELMILANQCAAQLLGERQVPAVYRVQNPPDNPLEQEAPLRLKGAVFSTRPAPHFSLGLAAYTQMTSPIRRYIDLVLHRQLKATLREETPPYTEQQLSFLLASSEQARTAAAQVERETNRYWLLKYLQQHAGEHHTATVLEFNDGRAFLHIEQYLLDTAVYPRNRVLKPGDVVTLRVSTVDPHRRFISFLLAEEPAAVAEPPAEGETA